MNNAQITNLVTTVAQLAMGALVTKGLISGSEAESITGAVVAIAAFVITHNWHATTPTTKP